MYESETFIYLDLPKTGTNFIIDFLDRFNGEGKGRRHMHRPAPSHKRKFRFISVRDPLDQYISLYSFGCDSVKGKLVRRMIKSGQSDLYDGTSESFNKWLTFVLMPENARILEPSYAKAGGGRVRELIGFQSFRFLNLALPGRSLDNCNSRQDIVRTYKALDPPLAFVRYSNLVWDLKRLVQNELRHSIVDQAAALAFLDDAPALNASNRIDRNRPAEISDDLHERLRSREWFFYEGFVAT